MKRIKNNTMSKLSLLALCIFVSACYPCYSDSCWQKKERTRFLNLSPDQQKKEREECKKWVPVSCYTYSEPTPEELKKLKNKKETK